MIIAEELIKVMWGPQQIPLPLPVALRGAWLWGDAAVEKYRLLCVVVGLLVFGALTFVLSRTKVGLLIRAVDLIPGATEYAYAVNASTQLREAGVSTSENRHLLYAPSDMQASLDALQALCPNLESVALVVAWFGDDLDTMTTIELAVR